MNHILYGSALNDVTILWYRKICLSLAESLVCVNKKSSTKKSGQVEFKTRYLNIQMNLLAN